MKKIMTFAVLAAFAASAQAATISWGLGGEIRLVDGSSSDYLNDAVIATDGSAPSVEPGSYFALVYVGQNVETFDIGSISASSIVTDDASSEKATSAFAVDEYGFANPYSIDTATTAYENGASFGVVWFNGTSFDYMYSGDDGSALNQTITMDDMSARGSGAIFPAVDHTTSYAGIVVVPEPSVALMGLLGLGMLLKRRRA